MATSTEQPVENEAGPGPGPGAQRHNAKTDAEAEADAEAGAEADAGAVRTSIKTTALSRRIKALFGTRTTTSLSQRSGTPTPTTCTHARVNVHAHAHAHAHARARAHAEIPTISSVVADSQEANEAAKAKRLRGQGSSPRPVWAGRLLFLLCLTAAAVLLAACAHYFLTSSEKSLAESQYVSITDRALNEAVLIAQRNKWAMSTMAEVVAQSQPNPEHWPFVTVPGFEQIGLKLHESAGTAELLSMAPLVTPEQLPVWEDYAYDYIEHTKGYPLNTTGAYNFIGGRGTWTTAGDGKNNTVVRDTTGQQPNSRHQVLFPTLQMQLPFPAVLLYSLRSGPVRTKAIDTILDTKCSFHNDTQRNVYPTHRCGAISDMIKIGRLATRGPAALLYQGIYPPGGGDGNGDPMAVANANAEADAENDTSTNTSTSTSTTYHKSDGGGQKLTGLLATIILLDETLDNIFAPSVTGIDCVISNQDSAFTYSIVDGKAVTKGDGDLHNSRYQQFRKVATLTDPELYTPSSHIYILEIYPSDAFYEIYNTNNPLAAAIGAVCVIVLASLVFLVFDFVVRKEFQHKGDLLEAKRRFMRYVSHEVRTPLNSVCMGLTLMERELQSLLATSEQEEQTDGASTGLFATANANATIPNTSASATGNPQPDDVVSQKVTDCIQLAEEIEVMAESAVGVLSDLLNFDKIESGTLQLELSLVPIFKLVELTTKEFAIPAIRKNITLKTVFRYEPQDPSTAGSNKEGRDIDIESAQDALPTAVSVETTTDALPKCARSLRAAADVVRMTQVFRNLVSNAIKFTPEGGSIVVDSVWKEEDAHETRPIKASELGLLQEPNSREDVMLVKKGILSVSVVDSGAGMDADQVSRLFNAGVQFNANKLQDGGGSGLGLYIAKGIVEQHKGRLSAASEGLGKGTTFTFKLPVYSLMQPANGDGLPSFSTISMMTEPDNIMGPDILSILVVDDTVSNRKLLARLLKMDGHTCDQAEDGQMAVDMVKKAAEEKKPYDVVLMDYEMPILDGPSATRVIRDAGYEVFIVGVTGNVLPEDIAHFRSCGANAVLPKPIRLPDLNSIWMEYWLSGGTLSDNNNRPGCVAQPRD